MKFLTGTKETTLIRKSKNNETLNTFLLYIKEILQEILCTRLWSLRQLYDVIGVVGKV